MLTESGCKKRRQRLWAALPNSVEHAVITDHQHLMYFGNYFQSPFVFRSNDAGAALILGRDGSSVLVADNLLQPFADKVFADEVVTPIWYQSKGSAPHREPFLVKNFLDQLKKKKIQSLAAEFSTMPVGVSEGLTGIQLHDIDPIVHNLKRSKDLDELALLHQSMRCGEAGMKAAIEELREGMTELEMYHLVQNAAMKEFGDQAVVYGDFVSGPRCEQIGGPPSLRKIQKGELILLDFSTVIYGYRADFANTFMFQGKPTSRHRELYDACVEAMQAGEAKLRPGTTGREIYQAVRGVLEAKHLENNFPHHAGHGIGLGHPEPPFLVPESSDTLVAGDVLTLEPGQYVAGVGGMRFERNYVITETGFKLLSQHTIAIEP